MAELPFLVVHGAVVWKILLPALVGGSIGAILLVRERLARRAARKQVRDFVAKLTALEEGDVCVRGRLRGGSLATLADDERLGRNHADGIVWIEYADGTRIEIGAPPRVVVGSRVRTSSSGVPMGTPAPLADRGGTWTLRTISDGDEVTLAGNATRIMQGDAQYRDGSSAWRVDDKRSKIVALVLDARPRPYHPIAMVVVLGLALGAISAGWYGVLHKVGSAAANRAAKSASEREIAPFGPLAIAAAMPGSREPAIETAVADFLEQHGRRGSSFATRDALEALLGPCPDISRLLREVRLEAALAASRACEDRDSEAWIQLFLGNYEVARSLEPESAFVRELAAIGLGDWRAAAGAAEAANASTSDANCRAIWYRSLAGLAEPHGFAPNPTPICELYEALVRPVEQRRTLLHRLVETNNSISKHAWTLLGIDGDLGNPNDFRRDYLSPADWLSPFEPDDPANPSTFHSFVDVSRVRIAWLRGDAATAHRVAARIPRAHIRDSLTTWIALREGSALPTVTYPDSTPDPAVRLRAGEVPDGEVNGVYPESCLPDLRAGVRRALDGDGAPLAGVFAECHVFYVHLPELLFGILPRVTQHRAELADALRAFRSDITTYQLEHIPFHVIDDLAVLRDTARLAGDAEDAERFQAIIARHAEALGHRDRAIAFMLLAR